MDSESIIYRFDPCIPNPNNIVHLSASLVVDMMHFFYFISQAKTLKNKEILVTFLVTKNFTIGQVIADRGKHTITTRI